MLISVRHVTRYVYDAPLMYSVETLKLTPPSFDGQKVVSWQIEAPGIARAATFRDGFGNLSHLVAFQGEHSVIEITARGLVETADRAGVARGLGEVAPVRVYLRMTPATEPDSAIRALAAEAAPDADLLARLHALKDLVADRVAYEVGETHSHTTAAEALADGRGVCQDHAHVFISAARVLGVPARYVNGYMVGEDDRPAEAHHGWAEAHVDGIGWIGFDPANRICPTDRYVRLVTGLDAASAAPIRGLQRGGASERLDVHVEVAQQVMQQTQQQ